MTWQSGGWGMCGFLVFFVFFVFHSFSFLCNSVVDGFALWLMVWIMGDLLWRRVPACVFYLCSGWYIMVDGSLVFLVAGVGWVFG